jgi:hypothetical protein
MVQVAEETWVNVTEGAERTGYSRDHVQELARVNWNKPETERLIKVRRRSNGYDMWLPDLVAYIETHGHGPKRKRVS